MALAGVVKTTISACSIQGVVSTSSGGNRPFWLLWCQKVVARKLIGQSPESMASRKQKNQLATSRGGANSTAWLFASLLLVLLIYSNTFDSPFVFDDIPNITKNPHVRLVELQFDKLREAAFDSPSSNRPLSNLSFALNYYVHDYDPAGYRWVNIVLHMLTGVLLYFLFKVTLNIPSMRTRYQRFRWMPLLATLFWLVHPIQVNAVTYVVQRMTVLATFFYLLSMFCYVGARLESRVGRKRLLFFGCVSSGILSLSSKEIAATLPFTILLYEWYFFQDADWSWIRKRFLPTLLLLIAFGALVWLYLGADPFARILESYENRDFTLSERLLTELRVVIFYLSLFIFPHPSRLTLDYEFPLSHSFVDPPTTLFCFVILSGLLGVALFRGKRDRLLSFGILWFLGNLLIESSIIGLEIIFLHRMYLPSAIICLATIALLADRTSKPWMPATGLTCVSLLFAFWTHQWNEVWHDELTLWKDNVVKAPGKSRPHINLGNALRLQGRPSEALEHYQRALEIRPEFAETHYNAGVALYDMGETLQSVESYQRAIELDPKHAKAHNNLGRSMATLGHYPEAKGHYQQALKLKPNHATAHLNLGTLLADEGKYDEAIQRYVAALRLQPRLKEAHAALGFALANQKQYEKALRAYGDALRVAPHYPAAHFHLAQLLVQLGRESEAVLHYRAALRGKPNWGEAREGLEHLLQSTNRSQ